MRLSRIVLVCSLLLIGQLVHAELFIKPYIQLGANPQPGSLCINWAVDDSHGWSLQYREKGEEEWRQVFSFSKRRVDLKGVKPHTLLECNLKGLAPGADIQYQLLRNGQRKFHATARANKSNKQPYRFAVFGDCGADSPQQRALAHFLYSRNPDFLAIPGDIVYPNGRVSEYLNHYFPVYNSDTLSPKKGAPLLRSILSVSSLGNHDVHGVNLNRYPDGLGYYIYWSQPCNGLLINKSPSGNTQRLNAFSVASNNTYRRMGNFSFDYGNSHWVFLDSNSTALWKQEPARSWLKQDLYNSKALWKFVVFHHAPFHSTKYHQKQKHMRVLHEIFEVTGVDIVFSGHIHNYQRSKPVLTEKKSGYASDNKVMYSDDWSFDKSFDGEFFRKTKGVIYIVSGAGGAHLYEPKLQNTPSKWKSFTAKYIGMHSVSIVDVRDRRITLQQATANGALVDQFTLAK